MRCQKTTCPERIPAHQEAAKGGHKLPNPAAALAAGHPRTADKTAEAGKSAAGSNLMGMASSCIRNKACRSLPGLPH
jgi:hypothetical protein